MEKEQETKKTAFDLFSEALRDLKYNVLVFFGMFKIVEWLSKKLK